MSSMTVTDVDLESLFAEKFAPPCERGRTSSNASAPSRIGCLSDYKLPATWLFRYSPCCEGCRKLYCDPCSTHLRQDGVILCSGCDEPLELLYVERL